MAEWLCNGLQNRLHRFNSGPGLHFHLSFPPQGIPPLPISVKLKGFLDAATLPGIALGSTMMGFSTIAKEAGFDFSMTLITTLSVWGMPGQVAFVSLYAGGASIFLMFVAVALANMRMLLMVITGADILRLKEQGLPLWKRIMLMHFLAITSWTQINVKQSVYSPPQLLSYYISFTLTIFAFGALGTSVGYFLDELIEPDILRLIIYITPLYILLLLMKSRQTIYRYAAIWGGALCPFFYIYLGDWAIFASGLAGGTMAFFIQQLYLRVKLSR